MPFSRDHQPAKFAAGKVTPLQWKGSADIYTLAQANALLVRDEREPARAAGETVRLIEL